MPPVDMIWVNAILLVALLAVLYFFFLRPDRKAKQDKAQVQNQLKVGDRVSTRAGIHGTVTAINGDLILMETGKVRTELEVLRSAILGLDGAADSQKRTRSIPLQRD